MANKRQKGRNLMVFLKDESGETYSALAFAKSCSLSVTSNTEKVNDKDAADTGDLEKVGTDWTMDSNCVVSVEHTDGDKLLDLLNSGKKVKLKWARVNNPSADGLNDESPWAPVASGCWEGEAIVTSYNENAPAEGTADYTVTFTGTSELTKK